MKRKKYLLPIFIVLILLGAGIWFGLPYLKGGNKTDISNGNKIDISKDAFQTLSVLQDNLTEVVVAKSLGDDLIAKREGLPQDTSMENVASSVQTIVERMKLMETPDWLKGYQDSVSDWATKINTATENEEEWKKLSADPPDFSMNISQPMAESLLESSVGRLLLIQELGDQVIQQNDRDAMRFIAARLLVLKHWLNGLAHADIADQTAYRVIPSAFAYTAEGKRVCFTTYNKIYVCVIEAIEWTTDTYKAAIAVTQSQPNATDSWDKTWTKAKEKLPPGLAGFPPSDIKPGGGVKIIEKGLSVGEDTKPKYPPSVQSFYDDCKARGGNTTTVGMVKDRLPTTEGGYTCEYPSGGQQCWALLTYTGGQYMGGNPGCPELNLMPASGGSTLIKIKKPIKWDGTYTINETHTCQCTAENCEVSTTSETYQIVVRNNQIVTDWWGNAQSAPIDVSGNVTIFSNKIPPGYNDYVNLKYTDAYTFSKSENGISVSAKGSSSGLIKEKGIGVNNCTYQGTGSRTSG